MSESNPGRLGWEYKILPLRFAVSQFLLTFCSSSSTHWSSEGKILFIGFVLVQYSELQAVFENNLQNDLID